ncbi:TetR/AcrR family transcriptional regulator [Antrihabitans sp. YC3-6]|uniref:TetR/AcrR family transcriptional regulator n=1 Tax=Antrihabitans stalagmiti TaxID=2799499 RepID=A0A934NUQ8_9NOCA|nr:TetR/AcrR family transcriptional regulator [Antrihabitans stalagmiti]MBJ8341904.1 TetR/AcrR family transcriptional regulator [Antrihabitans stalagmiti]
MTSSNSDPATERILDAALQSFEEIGIRRTTIEDIARRAGIERVTVYRRVGSKDEVVVAVIGRESARLILELVEASKVGNTFDERIVHAFTVVMRHLWGHALANRLIALEPESALPRLTTGGTDVLASAVYATVALLEQSVADGLLTAADDFPARAEVLVRIIHSLMMTPRVHLDLSADEQLKAFALRYIVPIASGRS